jgi:5-methylcytosine-specific restriction endonuclease McrA
MKEALPMPRKDPEARKAYKASWYIANREKIGAQAAQRHAANPERRKIRQVAYRVANANTIKATKAAYNASHQEERRVRDVANRDHIHAYNATWYAEHREERKAYNAVYNAAHREERRLTKAAHLAAHPELNRASGKRHRARIAGAPVNDFTAAQWTAMKEHYGHCCVYCGKKQQRLTQDHLTPLSQGGSHTLRNIVPACKSCNSRKYVGPVLVPVQPLLL